MGRETYWQPLSWYASIWTLFHVLAEGYKDIPDDGNVAERRNAFLLPMQSSCYSLASILSWSNNSLSSPLPGFQALNESVSVLDSAGKHICSTPSTLLFCPSCSLTPARPLCVRNSPPPSDSLKQGLHICACREYLLALLQSSTNLLT